MADQTDAQYWKNAYDNLVVAHDNIRARLAEVEAELTRLHCWDGLMELLDERWPSDIFPTLPDADTRDPGPRIVSLLRWVDDLRARLAAVEAVHARYFDMDCRPCDAAPEPEDVWRYDRDFRAAARGDAQDRATEHNCCSCVDNIADDRDAAEARLAGRQTDPR